MPATNIGNIKTIEVLVHVQTRQFQVNADENQNATPDQCKYSCALSGVKNLALLQSILAKLQTAYATNQPVTLCIDDNNTIVPDQNCP